MKRRKKVIAYCIMMMLIIVWLISSTDIIIALNGFEKPNLISADEFEARMKDPGNNTVLYYIMPELIRFDSTLEDIDFLDFAGWTFVKTEGYNSDRYTSILLKGETDCYELRFTDYVLRADALAAYSASNVSNKNVGYRGDFSTAHIPYGVYDVYLYCWENETSYGIADTGYQIVKTYDMFDWVQRYEKQETNPIQVTESSLGRHYVDAAEVKDGGISIAGWAFVEGEDTADQTIFIDFINDDGEHKQYASRSVSRPGVVQTFKSELYRYSGFTATIPIDDLPDGVWKLQLFVKNGGRVWASDSDTFTISGNTIELQRSPWYEIQETSPVQVTESNLCRHYVDAAEIKEGIISIYGWAFAEGEDTSNQAIFINFTKDDGEHKQYATRSILRPGVVEAFKSDLYQNSGFAVTIPVDDLPDGVWELQLLVQNGERVWASTSDTLTKSGGTMELQRAPWPS